MLTRVWSFLFICSGITSALPHPRLKPGDHELVFSSSSRGQHPRKPSWRGAPARPPASAGPLGRGRWAPETWLVATCPNAETLQVLGYIKWLPFISPASFHVSRRLLESSRSHMAHREFLLAGGAVSSLLPCTARTRQSWHWFLELRLLPALKKTFFFFLIENPLPMS